MHQYFITFLWLTNILLYTPHFIYLLISWWIFELLLLFDMVNIAMNILVQVFIWAYVFSSLHYVHRSRIAGSHGNSIFNFLRNCTIGQWPNHFTSSPAIYDGECSNFSIISPTFIFCFDFFFYLNYSHSGEYLIVVLISAFLITNDVEYIPIFIYTFMLNEVPNVIEQKTQAVYVNKYYYANTSIRCNF